MGPSLWHAPGEATKDGRLCVLFEDEKRLQSITTHTHQSLAECLCKTAEEAAMASREELMELYRNRGVKLGDEEKQSALSKGILEELDTCEYGYHVKWEIY